MIVGTFIISQFAKLSRET